MAAEAAALIAVKPAIEPAVTIPNKLQTGVVQFEAVADAASSPRDALVHQASANNSVLIGEGSATASNDQKAKVSANRGNGEGQAIDQQQAVSSDFAEQFTQKLADWEKANQMPDKDANPKGYEQWMDDRAKFKEENSPKAEDKDTKAKSEDKKDKPQTPEEAQSEVDLLQQRLLELYQRDIALSGDVLRTLTLPDSPEKSTMLGHFQSEQLQVRLEIQQILKKLGEKVKKVKDPAAALMVLMMVASMTQQLAQQPDARRT